MTYADRERIFAKDILYVADVAQLMNMAETHASALMCQIRRKAETEGTLRWNVKGQLHVQDWLDYFHLTGERYCKPLRVEG